MFSRAAFSSKRFAAPFAVVIAAHSTRLSHMEGTDEIPFSDPKKPSLEEILIAIKREAKKGTIILEQEPVGVHSPEKPKGFAPDSGTTGWYADDDAASQFPLPLPAYATDVDCVVVDARKGSKPSYQTSVQKAAPPNTKILFANTNEELVLYIPRASVLAILPFQMPQSLIDLANSTHSLRYIHFLSSEFEKAEEDLAPRLIVSSTPSVIETNEFHMDDAMDCFCLHLEAFCNGEAMPCRLER
jgi:hypothetical protein